MIWSYNNAISIGYTKIWFQFEWWNYFLESTRMSVWGIFEKCEFKSRIKTIKRAIFDLAVIIFEHFPGQTSRPWGLKWIDKKPRSKEGSIYYFLKINQANDFKQILLLDVFLRAANNFR